ncbi:MAG TPA: FAD binding domain-containing protein [Anaerolineaceae bacterium]|nr:FAD binding domain-containing protein [Anaerolineaceae bacterium]
MFVEYFRPKTIDEALQYLGKPEILAVPLGGGTTLSHGEKSPLALVDLQDLPLNRITRQGNLLKIGSTVRLQTLLESPGIQPGLAEVVRHETTLNLRNMATIAGSLVTADGKSTLATALLALDAKLRILPGEAEINLGDWLLERASWNRRNLIAEIEFSSQPELKWEMVARSPEDRPIVCVAVAVWPSGRTRVALGGYGKAPVVAMDGPESAGADAAAENAYSQATDAFASGSYRSHAAKVMIRRLLGLGEMA